MPPKSKTSAKTSAKGKPRKIKIQVPFAHAHVKSSFNNTIVTITDPSGKVLVWSSAGDAGFKGSKKSTPYAAGKVAELASEKALEYGVKRFDVFVKGSGPGRETAARALSNNGIEISSITDVTPIAHNGVKSKKRRRP